MEMVTVGPWVAGLVVASRRRIGRQLEQRARELEEERELFAFEKTVLQPAPEVISNGLGVTHLLVAGPARWFKAGVGHFAAQHFHGHAMLQRH